MRRPSSEWRALTCRSEVIEENGKEDGTSGDIYGQCAGRVSLCKGSAKSM